MTRTRRVFGRRRVATISGRFTIEMTASAIVVRRKHDRRVFTLPLSQLVRAANEALGYRVQENLKLGTVSKTVCLKIPPPQSDTAEERNHQPSIPTQNSDGPNSKPPTADPAIAAEKPSPPNTQWNSSPAATTPPCESSTESATSTSDASSVINLSTKSQ